MGAVALLEGSVVLTLLLVSHKAMVPAREVVLQATEVLAIRDEVTRGLAMAGLI